jgi:hypothetical protein
MLSRESFVMRTSVVRAAFFTREEYNTPPWAVECTIQRSITGKIFPCGSSRYGTYPNSST